MILKNEIENVLKQKAKSLGCDDQKVVVSFSNRPELCDFQCNYAMMMAKMLGKKPIDLANELIDGLTDENFEFSAVMPGFINIKITDKKLSAVAQEVAQDKD